MDNARTQRTTRLLTQGHNGAHPNAASSPLRPRRRPEQNPTGPSKQSANPLSAGRQRDRGRGPFSIDQGCRDSVLVLTNSDRFGQQPQFESEDDDEGNNDSGGAAAPLRKTPYQNIMNTLSNRRGSSSVQQVPCRIATPSARLRDPSPPPEQVVRGRGRSAAGKSGSG